MNKFETMKAEKDGLDIWPDLLAYAANGTPIAEIPEADLSRMKWYGVFHRQQKPGTFMIRLRLTGGQMSAVQARAIARVAEGRCRLPGAAPRGRGTRWALRGWSARARPDGWGRRGWISWRSCRQPGVHPIREVGPRLVQTGSSGRCSPGGSSI